MKATIIGAVMALGVIPVSLQAQPLLEKRIQTLEERVSKLEKRVAQLETPSVEKSSEKIRPSSKNPQKSEATPLPAEEKKKDYPTDKVKVELIKKEANQVALESGDVAKQLQIMLMFTNTTGHNVTKCEGIIGFKKTTGEEIVSFDLTFDKTLEAGKQASWYGAIDISTPKSRDLLQLDKKDIVSEYGIKSLTYADGTVKTY
ncbi:MAG: hypothetical protein GF401_10330 [Chitinivibrionales bacterium]|nr:hypothetical protein [Chitinivibrionales bacterium]